MRWLLVTAIAQPDDVGSGAHLNAALAQRPLDERDFEFDGRAGLKIAWREEIDAARADIAGYEGDGNGFEMIADARETERQRERRARIVAAFARDANGVRGNARKTLWPGLPCWRCNAYCVAFDFTQRRHDRPQPLPNRSSPHVLSPKNSLNFPPKPVKRICAESGTASREVMGGCRIVQQ